MSEENNELLPQSTKVETSLDIAAFVSSVVPWIGGPVSNVLGGLSFGRKMNRVCEVLEGLTSDLKEFKSDVSEEYVRTEDFEDILEQSLKRVAEERNEGKRNMYRAFLTDAVESPGETYDEQLRFLRTLEELQPDHLLVLSALSQEPDSKLGRIGSRIQTLRQRLPNIPEVRIAELVDQLNTMRLTNLTTLKGMMSAQGAADLRNSVTSYGQRFIQYLVEA